MGVVQVGSGFMRYGKMLAVLALFAPGLAACATQQAMTVAGGTVANPSPKYRNAIAVRSVSGGQVINVLTVPGVANEPLKEALESTLAANGYLAQSGTPKFYLDAEIKNLDQPLIGFTYDVTADVTYKISGAGPVAAYPVKTTGTASFSDSPLGADRIRIANERAMHENIKQFLQALR
jgi:hypothetical protein